VVVTGPGSYTGLRAGMAAALGLAHAAGLRLHGLSSLEATAHSASSVHGAVLAVVDAGRSGVYVSRFVRADGGRWLGGPAERLSLEELSARSLPLTTLDRTGLPGVEPGDPAMALARAVPAALSRPPLKLTGLTATYMS
jgi:tRNA A37 threonylcarbamoyladenosine modification protein TsaB